MIYDISDVLSAVSGVRFVSRSSTGPIGAAMPADLAAAGMATRNSGCGIAGVGIGPPWRALRARQSRESMQLGLSRKLGFRWSEGPP